MAEFKEVMHQFERMCEFYRSECPSGCHNCPLNGYGEALERCSITMFEKYSECIEREIMNWAKEHPEPTTVYEWLVSLGLLSADMWSISDLNKPIPADIAQKLGIKPKET